MTEDFKRVLIANRGEIALRVVRACRDGGPGGGYRGGRRGRAGQGGQPLAPGRRTGLTQALEGPLALARRQARERRERAGQAADGAVSAPMQGTVVRVMVAEGEAVTAGQTVAQGAAFCRIVPAIP